MRVTRAYIEGYFEGRFGNRGDPKCPHQRTQSVNEWNKGHMRGLTIRHFSEDTQDSSKIINDEVLRIRRARGEIIR